MTLRRRWRLIFAGGADHLVYDDSLIGPVC